LKFFAKAQTYFPKAKGYPKINYPKNIKAFWFIALAHGIIIFNGIGTEFGKQKK
jgi:hypothetical protein